MSGIAVRALVGVGLVLALAACRNVEHRTLAATAPEPPAAQLRPGLSPVYFYGTEINAIGEFMGWPRSRGELGAPLIVVDYRSGAGTVLTSRGADLVAARIDGFIHLEQVGTYRFAFESNDGARLEIAGDLVVQDPGVHPDRLSASASVEVRAPGWYPITVWYFEKRNTSTLRLLWTPPSGSRLDVVPGAALAHAAS